MTFEKITPSAVCGCGEAINLAYRRGRGGPPRRVCPTCYRRGARDRSRRRRAEVKAQVLALLGGRCAQCGNRIREYLELDHVAGNGGALRRSTDTFAECRRALTEPSDFQLLCANCHKVKSDAERRVRYAA